MQKAQYPAIMLNVTSLRKGRSIILKGVVRHTAPATAVDTKMPAPKSSPKTSSEEEEDAWIDDSRTHLKKFDLGIGEYGPRFNTLPNILPNFRDM